MRVFALSCAALAATSGVVAAEKQDWAHAIQEVAAALKETGDKTAQAIAEGSEHAKELITDIEKQIEQSKGPLKDAIAQAMKQASAAAQHGAEQVAGTVTESAHKLQDTIAEIAQAVADELNKAADSEDGANKANPPAGVVSVSLDAGSEHDPKASAGDIKKAKCFVPCPRIYLPVCGTDGVTYSNKCEMGRIACEKDLKLDVLHLGKCDGPSKVPDKQTDPCWKACTEEYTPVCGSDGVTYPNECLFKIEQCHMGGEGMLWVKSQGRCEEKTAAATKAACMKACTREYMPICGTDGKTYSNKCVFEIGQCESKVDGVELMMAYKGRCQKEQKKECPMMCTMEYSPVCGTDGQTYGNKCALRAAACKAPDLFIELAHEGECTEADAMATAVNAHHRDHGAKADVMVSIVVVTLFSLLAVVMTMFAARRMYAARREHGIAPPPYSKLLAEDNDEADPDELFADGYTRETKSGHAYVPL